MYGIVIDPESSHSQYRQLYQQFRNKILQGEIAARSKIASTRQLAVELKLSRTIILEVIDQLKVEGFLETRHGSGTYVKPSVTFRTGFSIPDAENDTVSEADTAPLYSMIAGLPDPSLFPRRAWKNCYDQVLEYGDDRTLAYCPGQGHPELRKELSAYLYRSKGIKASERNIIITAGAAQGLSVLADLKAGGNIVLEDPLVSFVPELFLVRRFQLLWTEVDEEGVIPDRLDCRNADYLYLSPSHQFPLGGTLSIERRIEILRKASSAGTVILEDDYDGEYRYENRPVAPLQTLSPKDVVYIGTFSKNLSPAIRIGYMVLPDRMMTEALKIKRRFENLNEGFGQLAMARFIAEGHLERHLRKTRRVYRKRKEAIEQIVAGLFGSDCELTGKTTGVHLVLRFPGRNFPSDFSVNAREKGLLVQSVSQYCMKTDKHKDKLILGFGQLKEDDLEPAFQLLKEILDSVV